MPTTPITLEQVKKFAAAWYLVLDQHAPIEEAYKLLASDGYARHLQNLFDALLLDRRPDKHVKRAEWDEFLRSSFAAPSPF